MTVTDRHVATLRAQLAGDLEEHQRLLDQLDPVGDNIGFNALIAAAAFEAICRRFLREGQAAPKGDVIAFVGDVRSRDDEVAEKLDPKKAERIIQAALGRDSTADMDGDTVVLTQMFLLAALIYDEGLSDAELDSFLSKARATAEEWTS